MSAGSLLYREEQGIGYITLNRPEVLNALNRDMLSGLLSLLGEIGTDSSVRGIIITGAGEKAFSAGADIQFLTAASAHEVRDLARLAIDVNHAIETLGKVSVAAINGYALGGGLELAEACMLRLAVPQAQMGHPEVRIGAVAGWGGTTRLPRLIGKGRAAELLLTGRQITAPEAERFGLVNKVVPGTDLLGEAEALLREILSQGPVAVALTWEAVHRGLNMTAEESALLGADYFGLAASTEDFREGTKAFLKKVKPSFKGR
ncbi:MAG: enoyl-CoA hydratase [Nitrospirae bacterium]|nr:MAG: enoyl-CoA hydratase [Nitrospirota bacterium]